jgi:hypothetical protein
MIDPNDILSCQLACTRFTTKTYLENRDYCTKKDIPCIYGTPRPIRQDVPENIHVAVIEMNIEKEEEDIKGIGIIQNNPLYRKYKIYKRNEYNMYAYMGVWHISMSEFRNIEFTIKYKIETTMRWCITGQQIYEKLVSHLLRGKAHSKRGYGITQFPVSKFKIIENELEIPACLTENRHLTLYKLIYIMLKGFKIGVMSYTFKTRFKN